MAKWQAELAAYPAGFAQLVELSQAAGTPALTDALRGLVVPGVDAASELWQAFADQLRQIMQAQRDLEPVGELSAQQHERLADYFAIHELLVQCLKLAAVSDRQAILNNLLLPPKRTANLESN